MLLAAVWSCALTPPPVSLQLLWRYGHSCNNRSNNLSPFMQICCVCSCVGGSQAEDRVPGCSASRPAPFGGENERCCPAPPQDLYSTTGGKHRGDVGRWAVRKAARCEPHFSRRSPRSDGTAVCVPALI